MKSSKKSGKAERSGDSDKRPTCRRLLVEPIIGADAARNVEVEAADGA